jgi:hypothetical protein
MAGALGLRMVRRFSGLLPSCVRRGGRGPIAASLGPGWGGPITIESRRRHSQAAAAFPPIKHQAAAKEPPDE